MKEDGNRRKREPRVARPLTVRVTENPSADKPRWDIVMARDISASGILFNYDHYLEPGTRIYLKVSMPSGEHVECESEVVRNVRGSARGVESTEVAVCAVAATFRNICEDGRQLILNYFRKCYTSAAIEEPASPREFNGETILRAKRIDRQYITRIQRQGSETWELVPVKNISATGILINYCEALEVGMTLSFQITLPFLSAPTVCRGEIVRVVNNTNPGALIKVFGIGVKFSDLDETIQQRLNDYAGQIGRE